MSEFKKKVKELNDDYEFKQFLTQEEDENNIKIAKNLLNMNMSLENISKVTGLKINEIKAINTEK